MRQKEEPFGMAMKAECGELSAGEEGIGQEYGRNSDSRHTAARASGEGGHGDTGERQALSSWRMAPLSRQCLDQKENPGGAKRTTAKNRDIEL